MYRAFARVVGADLDEVELPLAEYPSLGSFFARRLRADARVVSADSHDVISPSDGTLAHVCVVEHDTVLQAKGKLYSLAQLLADPDLAAALERGHAFTIYLSPRDYHRVHAPVSGQLSGYTYVPGTLFPVSRIYSNNVDELFARNERVVFRLDTPDGPVAVVMVGATGVGNVWLAHADAQTRRYRGSTESQQIRLDPPVAVEKGDELGAFYLGSTVVMVFGEGTVEPDKALRPDQAIAFGQSIGKRGAGKAASETVEIAG